MSVLWVFLHLLILSWEDMKDQMLSFWLLLELLLTGLLTALWNGREMVWFPGLFLLVVGKLSGERIGLGDGWLLLALGMWLPYEILMGILFLGLLAGAGYGILSGKKEIPLVPFFTVGFVLTVWETILKRLRPIAEKANVEVVFESNRSVSAEIDASRLSLAFSNLVENAIKYNNENGWVRVTLDADHKFFYVKVSDSGMGIPQESLDYIFERFYRVDKSHSREIGGTGLGLAITKSAVVAHRGAIKVQSKLGEGTTFTVRIPLRYIV